MYIMIEPEESEDGGKKGKFRNLPWGVSEDIVKQHIISPEHIKNVRTEPGVQKKIPGKLRVKSFPSTPHLDLASFGLWMHVMFNGAVAGYMLQIRQNGNLVHTANWQWAQTPDDKGEGWTEETKMHVASVSKFLTAVAMVKCLDDAGIPYSAKIINYLPDYWTKGNNIEDIQFQHLLTQTSGFASNPASSASDYLFMKNMVATGIPGVGSYDYENMNFGLCRILIPIVNGDVDKAESFGYDPWFNDTGWDWNTILYYKMYMNANVFYPAGVYSADSMPLSYLKNALAYPADNYFLLDYNNYHGEKGYNSGDLYAMLGGAGWRLSTKELLDVMNHVRRKNTIIDKGTAKSMLENRFGIDDIDDTPAGRMYNKNGYYEYEDANHKKWVEQCVAFFLPNDMELVIFVNSPIGYDNFPLKGLVKGQFLNSLVY
jgi:hypothetical protein